MDILREVGSICAAHGSIALSQISKDTGIRLAHTVRSVRRLTLRNMVTRMGNRYHATYAIQKDYEKWTTLPKRDDFPQWVTRLPRPGISHFPALGDTKEKKETIQKKNTGTLPEQVISEWRGERRKYAKIGKRITKSELMAAKTLADEYDLDDIKTSIRNYFVLYLNHGRYKYLPAARTLEEFVQKGLMDKCLDLPEAKRLLAGHIPPGEEASLDELIEEERRKRGTA